MSGIAKRRRSDAERSIAAILDAALEVLPERPEASMGEIAKLAGVARQTVYSHYGSREALLTAVAERARARTVAALDAAEPEHGPPAEALARLTTSWWEMVAEHARVLEALSRAFPDAGTIHEFHGPILERVERLAERGQRSRDFDHRVPARWLAVAFLGLMHTAADEVAGGRLAEADAGKALERSVPRLFAG